MLDRFLATELEPVSGGLLATVGAWRLRFSSSGRDADELTARLERLGSEGADPQVEVWCEVEFDLTQGTLHALAFADEERRGLYRALRAIGGIGRVSAFAVLDAGELIDTLRAVAGQDTAYFKTVPGLGPKKIGDVLKALSRRYGGSLPQPVPTPVAALVEARDALVHSGWSLVDAEAALLEAAERSPRQVQDGEALLALVSPVDGARQPPKP